MYKNTKRILCPKCGIEFNVVLLIGKKEFKDGYHGECPGAHCGFWYFEPKSLPAPLKHEA